MKSKLWMNMLAVFAIAAPVMLAVAVWGCAKTINELPDAIHDANDLDTLADPGADADGEGEGEPLEDGVTDEPVETGEASNPDADIDTPHDPDVEEEVASGPVISRVSPEAVVHGAVVTLTGSGLSGTAVSVTLGGTAQTIISSSASEIRFGPVSDAQAVSAAPGDTDVIVTVDGEASDSRAVTVIHLVISELDSDTPTEPVNDDKEFIETSAGLAGVSLYGYVLVRYNGADDLSYGVTELGNSGGTILTDADGLLLIGNTSLTPSPDLLLSTNTLQNGPDAVAIHQGSAADFPNDTAVSANNLIDALVYDTSDTDDAELLSTLFGTVEARVEINEDLNNSGDTESIFRCCDARLDGRAFSLDCSTTATAPAVGVPTPKALNTGCP